MNRILGDPTQCRVFSPDVSVHWFPHPAEGTPCFCGEREYHSEDDKDEAAAAEDRGGET